MEKKIGPIITCVHQGFELYGSDRSFIRSVSALRNAYPGAVLRVIIPESGPIQPYLANICDILEICNIKILRKDRFFRDLTIGIPGLIAAVFRAINIIKESDVTYINTSVILDYYIASGLAGSRVISHIREIPSGIAVLIFRSIIIFSRSIVIFNSKATKKAFRLPQKVQAHILLNACEDPPEIVPVTYDGNRTLRVLLIGRFNAWKGQDLLVDAIAVMAEDDRSRLEVKMVGGGFRDTRHQDVVSEMILNYGLGNVIKIEPFSQNPDSLYKWADIVVVPSRRPEPFGLVAIEAMAQQRPVIAASHGGLLEIVDHEVEGLLFTPNDAESLASCLRMALDEPAKVVAFGVNGRRRFNEKFSSQSYCEGLREIFEQYLDN